ncbi:flavin reductase family protein [Kribbella soli]|uniref:Flavin reductase n=1 Tax=Kribbella soli TaxID=1124743 RepID=A0A4R0HJF5_9ACTN|nr:flavin reductase family protein [Kribbella soli]TCC11517.1 flavin reductase [Kribbella soli]
MTIHGDHPFLPPESERSPVRRFRGRLPSPVGLWTASYDGERAGLTVSSMLVADGEPGYVVGMIDPESDLWETMCEARTAVVSLLGEPHRQLADAFGYVAPAPGGPFRMIDWTDTAWGPAPVGVSAWVGCKLVDQDPPELGWGVQVHLEIVHVEIAADDVPALVHRRGRYVTI